jgi:hypothetical protein
MMGMLSPGMMPWAEHCREDSAPTLGHVSHPIICLLVRVIHPGCADSGAGLQGWEYNWI